MMDSTTLPPIEGARTAQPLDAMRISWWVWRGRRYAARATHGWTRTIRTAAVAISCAAWPLATLRRAISIGLGRTRYYFSHDDTAVVAVRSTRAGWLLTDYCSAHPGQGEGWWLRQWVLPVVYQAADGAGITVQLSRTPGRIAESCTAETPELRPSGSPRPGRVALARAPHAASA